MDQHDLACDMDEDCLCRQDGQDIPKGFIWSLPDLFGKRTVTGFSDGEITVKQIGKAIANNIISKNHYSKTAVWSSNLHLGVFVNDDMIGVLQFGPPMNPASSSKIVKNTPIGGCLELNRMWLQDSKPANCASRAISFAAKIIRKIKPDIQWVQSFADERCGKLGAVYQACSFMYLGSHKTTFYKLGDEWFHQSMMGRAEYDKRGWWSGPKIARLNANKKDAIPYEFNQYRYIKFIKSSARKNLLLKPHQYPKPTVEKN